MKTNGSLKMWMIIPALITFLLGGVVRSQAGTTQESLTNASGTIRYVAANGNDNGTCTSSSSPCRTIQYAVNQSISGDTILVASGTYTHDPNVDTCTFLLTRAVVCVRGKILKIEGGYSPNYWSKSPQDENFSIIDGQNRYRGVVVNGYNVPRTHLEMSGFTIQNGLAQGPTYLNPYEPGAMGGGMWVMFASVTLRDMYFVNNKAVGANTTSGDGGGADGSAIRIESCPLDTTCVIERVKFENNSSIGGSGSDRGGVAFGALFIYNSNVKIEDSSFIGNIAQAGSSQGTGISRRDGLKADALGGAIGIEVGKTITLARVEIKNNRANGGNGATYGGGAFGGGILIEDTEFFSMFNSIVESNVAQAGAGKVAGNPGGGGIQSQNNKELLIEKTLIISNSSIGGNTTDSNASGGPGAGGGLYIFSTRRDISYRATLKNVIIANNLAQQGNGIQGLGNGGGGGFVIQGVTADISHTTIAGNRLDPHQIVGQAFIVLPWPSPSIPSTVNLTNSIVADHREGGSNPVAVAVAQGGQLNLNYVLFANNKKDTNADNIPFQAGTYTGLSTALSTTSVNFIAPRSPYYNYRLRINSPAMDRVAAQLISEDFENEPRPFASHVDLGADEYWPFELRGYANDGEIHIDWDTVSQRLSGAVSYYNVSLTCESGASSPNEVQCGQSINVGSATELKLTGVTNFKNYTIQVDAYDSGGKLVATSRTITLFPTNLFVYLPLVVR